MLAMGDVNRGALQNTGYDASSGDTFTLAFDWTSAWNWSTSARINWRLLTTADDTTSGAVTEIASGFVDGKTGNGKQWGTSEVLTAGGTVGTASEGRDVWIEIYGPGSGGRWAFVDKVKLTVDTTPPPAANTVFVVR